MKSIDGGVDYDSIRQDTIRHLVGIGHAFMDSGQLFITGMKRLTLLELESIKEICSPFNVLVVGIGDTAIDVDINLNSVDDIPKLVARVEELVK